MAVFIDTETTGLDPSTDEILEIAIVDDTGRTLLNSLVRPERRTEWRSAEEINGIAPADVAGAASLAELASAIRAAVEGREVVIYNAGFDAGFLGELLDGAASIRCCMQRYAEHVGEWDPKRGRLRWHRLSAAADAAGFRWPGAAHQALADALACRAIWRHVQAQGEAS